MIKIERATCPDALRARHRSKSRKWKNTQVVRTLWKMQYHKCCYCEMRIPEGGHLRAVEHFRPQAVFQYLRNEWENLLLACAQCNGRKSDKFPVVLSKNGEEPKVLYLKRDEEGTPLLINPSDPEDDPEDHITFNVQTSAPEKLGLPKAKTKKGKYTINDIGLDTYIYVQGRRDYFLRTIRTLHADLLEAYFRRQDFDDAEDDWLDAKRRFEKRMSKREIFAAFVREYARQQRLDRLGVIIPSGTEA